MYENFHKKVNLLFDIIWEHPNSKILQITDGKIDLQEKLSKFTEEKSFIFESKFANDEFLKTHKYYSGSSQNDYVFLCLDIFEFLDKEYILERCYASLKNSGGLLLIFSKNESYYEYENLLENSNFVAISQIEIDDEVEVIYAKKMHGWGGAR